MVFPSVLGETVFSLLAGARTHTHIREGLVNIKTSKTPNPCIARVFGRFGWKVSAFGPGSAKFRYFSRSLLLCFLLVARGGCTVARDLEGVGCPSLSLVAHCLFFPFCLEIGLKWRAMHVLASVEQTWEILGLGVGMGFCLAFFAGVGILIAWLFSRRGGHR